MKAVLPQNVSLHTPLMQSAHQFYFPHFAEGQRVRPRALWPVLVSVGMLAGAIAAGIGALAVADSLTATGLPDPGPITTYGSPFVRAAGEVAAVVAIGEFLFAAFLAAPQADGTLDVSGYRALRRGSAASVVWTVCAALLVPLTVSDVSGQPLQDHLSPTYLWSVANLIDIAGAWRWTALLAATVTIFSLSVLRWSWTPVLLVGSLLSLVPLVLTGHSAAGGGHDLASNSLLIHVVAAALWAGGLLALLAHVVRRQIVEGTALAARRFSALALCCYVAIALSGIVSALVRIQPADLVGTRYGLLIVVKIVAFWLLGMLGWAQRRRGLIALQANPEDSRPLLHLALGEAALFGATFGIAVGLGLTPPPETKVPSGTEAAIGFDLFGPPTMARLLFEWRFDVVFGTAAIISAGAYVVAVRRLRRCGDAWSTERTIAWLLGCAMLLFTTSSGLGKYEPAMFSIHMITHMLLSILVPILMARGAPVTLALRALPIADDGAPPGPREWLLAALDSRVLKFLSHPVVATFQFVAGFYALHFVGIFDAVVGSHAAHLLMNLCFLLSGYLFFWLVIGVDPTSRSLPRLAKVGMVFTSSYAFFGVATHGMGSVLGAAFYRSLQLPWHVDLVRDQRLGDGIAWTAGEALLLGVMVALLIQRRRSDQRIASIATAI